MISNCILLIFQKILKIISFIYFSVELDITVYSISFNFSRGNNNFVRLHLPFLKVSYLIIFWHTFWNYCLTSIEDEEDGGEGGWGSGKEGEEDGQGQQELEEDAWAVARIQYKDDDEDNFVDGQFEDQTW